MHTKELMIPQFTREKSTNNCNFMEVDNALSHIQTDSHSFSTEEFSVIRFIRVCMGMNQKEFSQLCDISPIYCHELESGKRKNPSDNVLNNIAHKCGIKATTIRFFLDEQSGKSQLYKTRLIKALESIADERQNSEEE